MRIFDTFIAGFPHEKLFIDTRIAELQTLDAVHVIVESTHTFKGDPKPLYFDKIAEQYGDRVRYILVDETPDKDPWANERAQRDAIMRGLTDAQDEDLILISDADEIIALRAVVDACTLPSDKQSFLVQDKFGLYLNLLEGAQSWRSARAMKYAYAKQFTPDMIRNGGADFEIINAGWHWSYLGGLEAVLKKFASFSHQEEGVQKHATRENIEHKLRTGESLWGQDFWKVVSLDGFPQYIIDHQEELSHLIFKG